jgi:hypothetical protein
LIGQLNKTRAILPEREVDNEPKRGKKVGRHYGTRMTYAAD